MRGGENRQAGELAATAFQSLAPEIPQSTLDKPPDPRLTLPDFILANSTE